MQISWSEVFLLQVFNLELWSGFSTKMFIQQNLVQHLKQNYKHNLLAVHGMSLVSACFPQLIYSLHTLDLQHRAFFSKFTPVPRVL